MSLKCFNFKNYHAILVKNFTFLRTNNLRISSATSKNAANPSGMKKNCAGGYRVLKIVFIGGTNMTRIIKLKETS